MKGCVGCLGLIAFCTILVLGGGALKRAIDPQGGARDDARMAQIDREAAARRELLAKDPLAGLEFEICKKYQDSVRAQLLAPSTADFQSCVWHNDLVKYVGHGLYKVNFYVDAENAFGAKIRTSYYAEVDASVAPDGTRNLTVSYSDPH
jgi:hypothetical protein